MRNNRYLKTLRRHIAEHNINIYSDDQKLSINRSGLHKLVNSMVVPKMGKKPYFTNDEVAVIGANVSARSAEGVFPVTKTTLGALCRTMTQEKIESGEVNMSDPQKVQCGPRFVGDVRSFLHRCCEEEIR